MLKSKLDFVKAVLKYLIPLNKYFQNDNTQIKWDDYSVVYSNHIVGIEGFARALWGLTPLFANNQTFNIPEVQKFWKKIIYGLITGVSNNKNSWEVPKDFNQIYVETNSIAIFLLFNIDKIKKEYTNIQLNKICKYLEVINHHKFSLNNWQFFKVIINLALKKLNSKYFNEKCLFEALENINKCYLGDGWYFDGKENQIDYYNAWAYHFYGLLFSYSAKNDYKIQAKEFINRAVCFYHDYKYFFNKKGLQIPFGRSLIYRFAASSFFSALALNSVFPNGIKELKWFIVNNINYFEKYCSIFDFEGKLNLGFGYENYEMLEEYNSKTSPYWALKTFFILILEEKHEFWKTDFIQPIWKKQHLIKKINALIITDYNYEKYLINSGFYARFNPKHNLEKYSKEIYSTKHGFNILINNINDVDMQLYLSIDNINFFTKFKPPFKKSNVKNQIICEYEIEIGIIKSILKFNKNNKFEFKYIVKTNDLVPILYFKFNSLFLKKFKIFNKKNNQKIHYQIKKNTASLNANILKPNTKIWNATGEVKSNLKIKTLIIKWNL